MFIPQASQSLESGQVDKKFWVTEEEKGVWGSQGDRGLEEARTNFFFYIP